MQNNTGRVTEIIKHTIKRHGLISEGDKILIGLSGGADSVCLLHSLKAISNELGFTIGAIHVNHGIRGAEADRDMEFVKSLCRNMGVELFLETIDVPKLAKAENLSLETAGRLARYRVFHKICDENGFNKIATAHNRNDQAETVIMRIIRGTGIDGLSGIQYKRADNVIRPILDVERCLIESYLSENGVDYCTDSTNSDNNYTRNKIRNQLLPMLREEFNPNITSSLAGLAETAAEDSSFINGYTKRLYKRINSPAPSEKPVVLDIESLKMLEDSIRVRVIKLAVADVIGKSYKLEKSHTEAILNLLDKETGAKTELPENLNIAVRYGWLAFEKVKNGQADKFFADKMHYEVEIGKVYDLTDYSVSVELCEADIKLNTNQLMLDYDTIADMPLEIRYRKKGDRIAVFSDGRTRKLKDFMIDMKIPRSERDDVPLLCSGDEVIAVIGYRCAEPYKKNKKTKSGLVVTYDKKYENR